ncbi:hypothetical protein [Actinophytocola sp.]|uniref:hypothetical protein n=1 Tax=Actinophytocola sp. TaxID=1872138 RepID=UPI003899B507
MAHSTTSRHVVHRLLIATMLGALAVAGATQLAHTTSTTPPPTAAPAEAGRSTSDLTSPPGAYTADTAIVGAAGSSFYAGTSARAEGITITGANRLDARPTVSATSGTRLASEPTVQAPGDLVTATGITVAAAVTNGHSSAHAFIRNARYGHHDLGPLSVHCRDGVPEAQRTETVQLTRNIQVQYGQAHGNRITGASVIVLGQGDRVIRVVTVATVTCATASTTDKAPIPRPSPQTSVPDTPRPASTTAAPSRQARHATAPTSPSAPERGLLLRDLARLLSLGHRPSTEWR